MLSHNLPSESKSKSSASSSESNLAQDFLFASEVVSRMVKGAKVRRFGVTCKGQPWVCYEVNGKVCCQFISKKLWSQEGDRFLVGVIDSSCQKNSPFSSQSFYWFTVGVSTLHSAKNYIVTYNAGIHVTTNCTCPAGQHFHKCKHQKLVLRNFEYFRNEVFPVVVPPSKPIVELTPETACQKLWDELPQTTLEGFPARKLTRLAIDWLDLLRKSEKFKVVQRYGDWYLINPSQESAKSPFTDIWYGSQEFVSYCGIRAKRISLRLAEEFSTEGTEFAIVESDTIGKLLVKRTDLLALNAKVPEKIFTVVKDLVAKKEINWMIMTDGRWQSSEGVTCVAADLETHVRASLSMGHKVIVRTSKAAYVCSLDNDGKILKQKLVS